MKMLQELSDAGFRSTQATISRDIKELQLVKVSSESGGYCYSTPDNGSGVLHLPRLKNIFRECVIKVDRAQNLVVVKTLVGMANAAAAAVDALIIKLPAEITLDDEAAILYKIRNNEDHQVLMSTFSDRQKRNFSDEYMKYGPGWYIYFSIDGGDGPDFYHLWQYDAYLKEHENDFNRWKEEMASKMAAVN